MYFEADDHEFQIFSNVLEEAFIDHYVKPSIEWADLAEKTLGKEFPLFRKKKKQAEKFLEQGLGELHFGYEPVPYPRWLQLPPPEENDVLFQAVSKVLGPNSAIQNQVDLKRAFAALRWMLEKDVQRIPIKIQDLLEKVGIGINSSGINQWGKKDIIIQSIAQIFGYCNGKFQVNEIKSEILSLPKDIKQLLWLALRTTPSKKKEGEAVLPKDRARTLETNISSVNPISKNRRRGPTNKMCKLDFAHSRVES